MVPENAHFSHFEPRKRGSEPRFRVSKCAGISRVKIWLNFNTRSLHILVCEIFSDAMKPFQQSVLLRVMQAKEMINKVLSP